MTDTDAVDPTRGRTPFGAAAAEPGVASAAPDDRSPDEAALAVPAPADTAPADPSAGDLRIAGDPAMGAAAGRVRLAEISASPLSLQRMITAVTDPRCGAVVTFDGVVRNHDGGQSVDRLEYSAHPTAGEVIAEVGAEIAERYPDALVAVAHRHGPLGIGDSALVCAVAAPHRKQAFAACDDLVDTVKQRVPIWKHQLFSDGGSEWVGALG